MRVAFVLLFLLGCTEDLTQIMVVAGTDIERLDTVQYTVVGPDGAREQRVARFADGSPTTLALVHRGGALGPVTVTATGYNGETALPVTRSAVVDFLPGEIFVLRLDLVRSCLNSPCPETCTPRGCESPNVPETEPWSGMAPDLDGSVERDAGLDAPIPDGGPDTGCVPSVESCNGADDDCDGDVDEDFELHSDPAHCGGCGQACDGSETCDARVCSGDFAALAAGNDHSCATDGAGDAFCWGDNAQGQLGDGTTNSTDVPQAVVGISALREIVAGDGFTCARGADGQVWCWGADGEGQHGDGSASGMTITRVSGLVAVAVCAGAGHACAIADDGDVRCWGRNMEGQVGNGSTTSPVESPSTVTLAAEATSLACGGGHSCARLVDGSVWCWGRNREGQLGRAATTEPSTTPTAANLSGASDLLHVAAGSAFSCAVGPSGGRCWGENSDAQHGAMNRDTAAIPQQIVGLANGAWIDLGGDHACAIGEDGGLSCWGKNDVGQLGDRMRARETVPHPVDGFDDVLRVAAGAQHTCARRGDDTVWCWGSNARGQAGAPASTTVAPTRVAIPGL